MVSISFDNVDSFITLWSIRIALILVFLSLPPSLLAKSWKWFFCFMDVLFSAMALKVNCDLPPTLMASSLYRYLGQRVGNGYEAAKSRHLFRDFIDATALIETDERAVNVNFQKRAHNPLPVAAGIDKTDIRIPWLGKTPAIPVRLIAVWCKALT